MRILKVVVPAALLLGLAAGLVAVRADDPPKYSIKEVMDMAHKAPKDMKDAPSLFKKITTQKGTDDDKKMLVVLYTALAADHPKMNDDDDWKTRTAAMVAAATDVAAGKDGSIDALKKATACGDCHDMHRPPAK